MRQVEDLFHISGAGGLLAVGQIAHDVTLSGGELQFFQSAGHGLVCTPVRNAQKMSEMGLQTITSYKM
jgi:hypothetical protein